MAKEQQSRMSSNIVSDIRALNSSVLLLTQKLKFISRNEKILGRNIVVMNKKINELENKISSLKSSGIDESVLKPLKDDISDLKTELEIFSSKFATKEELKEIKYIIESINPLEFVTLKQVKELISDSLKKRKK